MVKRNQVLKRETGVTLIELMIVVAIIGILATIAVPNFISYRNKSRVAAAVGSSEGLYPSSVKWCSVNHTLS